MNTNCRLDCEQLANKLRYSDSEPFGLSSMLHDTFPLVFVSVSGTPSFVFFQDIRSVYISIYFLQTCGRYLRVCGTHVPVHSKAQNSIPSYFRFRTLLGADGMDFYQHTWDLSRRYIGINEVSWAWRVYKGLSVVRTDLDRIVGLLSKNTSRISRRAGIFLVRPTINRRNFHHL